MHVYVCYVVYKIRVKGITVAKVMHFVNKQSAFNIVIFQLATMFLGL